MPEREGPLQPESEEVPEGEQGLPCVSRETKEAMLSDLMQSARRNEMAASSREPYIAKNTGLFIIDLLRRQAAADRMKKQFGEVKEDN